MSPPQEHDYIGLTAGAAAACEEGGELNLKDTELCLGLPGSASPELSENSVGLTLGLLPPTKAGGLVAGAKRGFADAIDGTGKWGLSAGGSGFKTEEVKGGALFSPLGDGAGASVGGAPGCGGKDAVSMATAAGQEKAAGTGGRSDRDMAPVAKAQVVGWPPIRSYRKNTMAANPPKNKDDAEGKHGLGCLYVKVSMEGAPYLRKVDLKTYNNYKELSSALEKMFSCFTIGQCGPHGIPGKDVLSEIRLMDLLNGSEYVLTHEDKDGDWMLVGDVPWEMFANSCRRLRIMKGSDAIGLAPRAMEKCKSRG